MKFKLLKIGTELELNVGSFNSYYTSIRTAIYPKLKPDKEIPIVESFVKVDEGIEVQLAREYYGSQCEWKIKPIYFTESNIGKIQVFSKNRIEALKTSGRTEDQIICHNSVPEFVGTHIHLFFSCDAFKGEKFFRGKTFLSKFLFEYFLTFFKEKEGIIPKPIIMKELERMMLNHNILQRFDYNVLGKNLRKNLNNEGLDYYHRNLAKIKYQPVFWSAAKEGKPMTLELRYIPNSFMIYASSKEVFEFLTMIESIVNFVNSISNDDFNDLHNKNKADCILAHNEIIQYYKSLSTMTKWPPPHLPKVNNDGPVSIGSQEFKVPESFEYYYQKRRMGFTAHTSSFRMAIDDVLTKSTSYLERGFGDKLFNENDKRIVYEVFKNSKYEVTEDVFNSLFDIYMGILNSKQEDSNKKVFASLEEYMRSLMDIFHKIKTMDDIKIVTSDIDMFDPNERVVKTGMVVINGIMFDQEGNERGGKNFVFKNSKAKIKLPDLIFQAVNKSEQNQRTEGDALSAAYDAVVTPEMAEAELSDFEE